MLVGGIVVGFLMAEAGEGQFLGQKGGIEWQQEKIVVKMVIVLSLGGRIHTHKEIVFRSRDLFEEVKMR